MSTSIHGAKAPEEEVEFIATPEPAPKNFDTKKDCGVQIISVSITLELKLGTRS